MCISLVRDRQCGKCSIIANLYSPNKCTRSISKDESSPVMNLGKIL